MIYVNSYTFIFFYIIFFFRYEIYDFYFEIIEMSFTDFNLKIKISTQLIVVNYIEF